MYRAAVEQILMDQGYTVRMLGPKIGALEKAIAAETAPKSGDRTRDRILGRTKGPWQRRDPFRRYRHASRVRHCIAFASRADNPGLLFHIYDAGQLKAANLAALKAAAAIVKK